jgi:hypothetical protein
VSKTKKNKGRVRLAKGAAGVCLGCGKALKPSHVKCKKCGKASPLFAPKGVARPYLVKSAGKVIPFPKAQWSCWGGHVNKAAARHCTRCGEYRGTTGAQHTAMVAKAYRPGGPTLLGKAFAGEADPGKREELHKAITGAAGGQQAATIRALGGWQGVQWKALYDPDPGTREWCRKIIDTNGGAA